MTLNVDINLIGLKRARNNIHLHQCKQDSACYVTYYRFQNILTKLEIFDPSSFDPVILFEYKKKLYVLNIPMLNPLLISELTTASIDFENITLSQDSIMDIIANKPVNYPFSIAIYSAFSYIKYKKSKNAKAYIIGKTPETSDRLLHLFMNPSIGSSCFSLCVLDVTSIEFAAGNIKNMYSNPHITEGKPHFHSRPQNSTRDLLNQDFCVCDHPETSRYFAPVNRSFKSLGISHITIFLNLCYNVYSLFLFSFWSISQTLSV